MTTSEWWPLVIPVLLGLIVLLLWDIRAALKDIRLAIEIIEDRKIRDR